jgi:hypothetical protein
MGKEVKITERWREAKSRSTLESRRYGAGDFVGRWIQYAINKIIIIIITNWFTVATQPIIFCCRVLGSPGAAILY